MKKVKLTSVCRPKQWKSIPISELSDVGYPVYGANGVIGYYDSYNHEQETVIITCRGATCGTVNLTHPRSYVTGNAMCLDNVKDSVDIKYLFYSMQAYDFTKVISGTAQPQITRVGLEKVEITLPSLDVQREIVSILDKIDALIEQRRLQLKKLEELVKARFVEMFGDPRSNPRGFTKHPLKETCEVITGNTPSRAVIEYYGDCIEWIKTDNIVSGRLNPTTAKEKLSEIGMEVGRTVDKNSILMACIAGSIASIGKVCVTDRTVAFNQQINAIIPHSYNILFLFILLEMSKDYLVEDINMALKGILSKSMLEKKEFIVPPIELQNQFADFVSQIDKSKATVQKALDETQLLFDSLMQQYFG